MKKIFKAGIIVKVAIAVCVVAAVAWFVVRYTQSPEADRVRMHEASVSDVRAMARLCSVDIYEEIPVKGHIGKRHLFARMRIMGSISFDLDSLEMTERGDTLVVSLPEPIVEIREATDPDSYRVIDTWNEGLLGSSYFTTAEENEMKGRVLAGYRDALYRKGHVSRASSEAARNLADMLSGLTKRPVKVIRQR